MVNGPDDVNVERKGRIERVADRLFEGEEAVLHCDRTHCGTTWSPGTQRARFQAETEPLRLHQVVITAKPYASTPSKSTTA
jgi:hypothetical protein